MSKITNDGLTRSGKGPFTAVPIWQQWASKGNYLFNEKCSTKQSSQTHYTAQLNEVDSHSEPATTPSLVEIVFYEREVSALSADHRALC